MGLPGDGLYCSVETDAGRVLVSLGRVAAEIGVLDCCDDEQSFVSLLYLQRIISLGCVVQTK
jgi:hypothetical protein